MRLELGPERLAEQEVERLGGAVDGEPRSTAPGRARGDEQDASTAARHHRSAEVMACEHRNNTVALHHPRPFGRVDVEEQGVVVVGTGVVHEEADLQAGSRLGQCFVRGRLAQIDRHHARLDAEPFAYVLRQRLELLEPTRNQHNVQAALGQLAGEGRAGALRRAGDDRPRPVLRRKIV